jgi:adenylate kinase
MLRSLLLAPPGAGKGTQGKRIAAHYGVPRVATGDLLRQEVERHTAAGDEAAGFMARGELVPDALVVTLVLEQIGALEPPAGFVLDGFPRTINQATQAFAWGLARGLTLHAVIALDVPQDVLVERVVRRGKTSGRPDDTEETIRQRLRIYAATSDLLFDFYRHRGILIEVDGTGTVDEVEHRIRSHLDTLDLR